MKLSRFFSNLAVAVLSAFVDKQNHPVADEQWEQPPRPTTADMAKAIFIPVLKETGQSVAKSFLVRKGSPLVRNGYLTQGQLNMVAGGLTQVGSSAISNRLNKQLNKYNHNDTQGANHGKTTTSRP